LLAHSSSSPIADKLQLGQNSFGLLRLIAASMVVFSHAWYVTGGEGVFEPLQTSTGFTLGWHSVNAFFALSGLLIAGSLHHSKSLLQFVRARFLRLYPALLVLILGTVLCAFTFGDMQSVSREGLLVYLGKNLVLLGADVPLPGIFEQNPASGEINVPLWTLKYEVAAYFSAACVFWGSRIFAGPALLRAGTLLILAVSGVVLSTFGKLETYGALEHGVRLLFAFYLGVAVWLWRHVVSARLAVLLALSGINAGLLWFGVYNAASQVLLVAYASLWFGTQDFGRLARFTDRQDYSYGVYIIGFPIQQAVVSYSGILDPWVNFALSMPFVILLAALSWNLIENPALKLKRRPV